MNELSGLFVDATTGEQIERPLTEAEIADLSNLTAEAQDRYEAQEAITKARASALAKLKKLGLTDKEIAAL
jgi:hypothetical protein